MVSSAQRFQVIVEDFESALATLLAVLQHVTNTKPAAELRVVILNNTIVALTATIEEGLRAIFREYLLVLEENFSDHQKLRLSLQKANLECSIQELRKHNRNQDFKAAAAVAANLEKCLNGKPGYELLKEQLSENQGNFKSVQVTEISKNVGYSKLWSQVCDCSEIEEYTGASALEPRVNRLIFLWNEIFDHRDIVVHRISQASGWAPERIQQSIDLSKLVVTRVAVCLQEDADELAETKVSN